MERGSIAVMWIHPPPKVVKHIELSIFGTIGYYTITPVIHCYGVSLSLSLSLSLPTVVTIGFDQVSYDMVEDDGMGSGSAVQVCLTVSNADISRTVVVSVSDEDGTATGLLTYIESPSMHVHYTT